MASDLLGSIPKNWVFFGYPENKSEHFKTRFAMSSLSANPSIFGQVPDPSLGLAPCY